MSLREVSKSILLKTFADARSTNYQHVLNSVAFPEGDDRVRAALKYTELLAIQTRTDISNWKTVDFIFNADGEFDLDKKSINRKFFSRLEMSPREERNPGKIQITKTGVKNFNSKFARLLSSVHSAKGVKSTLNKELEEYKRQVLNHTRNVEVVEEKLYEFNSYQRMMSKYTDFNLTASLEEIVKDGFYSVPKQNPTDGISFITEPITLTYVNPQQGRNHIVQFGRYEVFVYPYEFLSTEDYFLFNAEVWPWEDNPVSEGYWHPHVSASDPPGGVCYGDTLARAHNVRKYGDLIEYMKLLKSILTSYNDGNPYMEIDTFQRARNNGLISASGWMPGQSEWKFKEYWRPLRAGHNRRGPERRGERDEPSVRGPRMGDDPVVAFNGFEPLSARDLWVRENSAAYTLTSSVNLTPEMLESIYQLGAEGSYPNWSNFARNNPFNPLGESNVREEETQEAQGSGVSHERGEASGSGGEDSDVISSEVDEGYF